MESKKSVANKEIIAIIGLGYVGLPLALLASRKGYSVVGIDTNTKRVEAIQKHVLPFSDEKLARELASSSLTASTNMEAVKNVDIIVICVPTPVYENNTPNLEPVKAASRAIGAYLKKGSLVVLESTVNPGVSENVVLPLLEEGSGLKGGRDFSLAHCPERINPGDERWTVENIPRVVGSLDAEGLRKALTFYRSILSTEVKPMGSLKEAEAVKIVENSFRDINIAFVNELVRSFSRLGIDIVRVIDGAATKPFAFLAHYPGCGVGGHCIPVDPYYLIEYAKKNGFQHDFLSLARRINSEMPAFTIELTARALNEKMIAVNGARVAVLGLAYKPDIDDCRESPAFDIIKGLGDLGADVVTFDPYVPLQSSAKSLNDALRGAQAVVIATAHTAFRALTPAELQKFGVSAVIDGRNCLDKEAFTKAGIIYKGIGR